MAISNVLLLSQLTANIVVCILSLCILIPMIVNKSDFRGHCLLFSTGTWREEDGQFEVSWASQGLCNYILFVGASLLIASITQICRLSTHLYKGQDSTFLEAFVDTVISSFLCIISVIACLIVTLGFDTWCRSITKRFEACEDATDNDIDEKDKIDTTGFYMHMGTAQFGVWASWACCVGTSVFAILKLCRYHQQENMRLSMAKAREHLLQKALSENGDANSSRSTINADDLNSSLRNYRDLGFIYEGSAVGVLDPEHHGQIIKKIILTGSIVMTFALHYCVSRVAAANLHDFLHL